ncbi:hypothetical protein JMUB7552_13560 [Staphylococcus aureus]|uniref:Uncharacterized protein n=1 Tax=Staphylococcus aureus (strain NCTC 8325 / PS 47) TaxID=93061 RepID=Q2FXU9_STAA8|nr:hypothetical protein SAOUHSC_01733 [Staphylococcus aureus subsp. aureus NCTC 8325]EEV06740.1 conserved hypothetical protein [Staphylococcus aureus subsp. aureus 65-1322]EEV08895.1 conserved hypothetical protein [Staphylococcus aureus subsp. aureus 68-397]EEV11966.1 conserved hypothetical protein [Staphylococcus aureus subsp. aureus E1410]EEV14125.1 conserved hypothetical protein [Staphylococcus aureus subsp. aureus M876]EFB47586.1 hypothetical protein SASG_00707 [Staphylococcus aureus subsp
MPLGPTKCCWEMISSIFFGRILDANGSVLTFVTPFLYYLNSKNAKMGISIFELSEVIQ